MDRNGGDRFAFLPGCGYLMFASTFRHARARTRPRSRARGTAHESRPRRSVTSPSRRGRIVGRRAPAPRFRPRSHTGHGWGTMPRWDRHAIALRPRSCLLFASADAVFSSAITNVFDFRKWSIGEVIGRVLLATAFAWIAGGLFVVAGRRTDTTWSPVLPRLRGLLSSTAGATTLLAVDALFVFFVALQVAYLFGGIDTLNATGLTYSSYARRGFFELIAVAVLAAAVVLGNEKFVRAHEPLRRAASRSPWHARHRASQRNGCSLQLAAADRSGV